MPLSLYLKEPVEWNWSGRNIILRTNAQNDKINVCGQFTQGHTLLRSLMIETV